MYIIGPKAAWGGAGNLVRFTQNHQIKLNHREWIPQITNSIFPEKSFLWESISKLPNQISRATNLGQLHHGYGP